MPDHNLVDSNGGRRQRNIPNEGAAVPDPGRVALGAVGGIAGDDTFAAAEEEEGVSDLAKGVAAVQVEGGAGVDGEEEGEKEEGEATIHGGESKRSGDAARKAEGIGYSEVGERDIRTPHSAAGRVVGGAGVGGEGRVLNLLVGRSHPVGATRIFFYLQHIKIRIISIPYF